MERILIKLTEKIGKEATHPENQVKKNPDTIASGFKLSISD